MLFSNIYSKSSASLGGTIEVAGDKSISHRALILAAIAEGTSTIEGFLESTDCLATMRALSQLGIVIEQQNGLVTVHGCGKDYPWSSGEQLDLENSGTAIRLLSGLLVGRKLSATLSGDASLARRPMQRIVEPLQAMGAHIQASEQGTPPLLISPAAKLTALDFELPIASAQVKSALLLAGLHAEGTTTITEPDYSRDHTERMLEAFACPPLRQGLSVTVDGQGTLSATHVTVPGDISSAAFFIVAACLVRGSDVVIKNLGINPTRSGAIEILRMMGADIEILSRRTICYEPLADLRIRARRLQGITIPPQLVPSAIDEFPVLFIAASCARGETRLGGASELRVKESDRIAAMAVGLQACGIRVEVYDDGIAIQGGHLKSAVVDSYNDHRVAMAFAVGGAVSDEAIVIKNCSNIATSFPNFVELANEIGLNLSGES